MAVIVQSVHCQCKRAARQHLMDKVGGGEISRDQATSSHVSHRMWREWFLCSAQIIQHIIERVQIQTQRDNYKATFPVRPLEKNTKTVTHFLISIGAMFRLFPPSHADMILGYKNTF